MFSVVIPLYNKSNFIQRAIESVLVQSFRDFEIIVINDGSNDESVDRVQIYEDQRIRLFSQKNLGVSAARNRGIKESKGQIIAFLDADDEWLPDYLQTIYDLRLKYKQAGVFGTRSIYKYSDGTCVNAMVHGRIIEGDKNACILDFYYGEGDTPLSSSSTAVLRDAIVSVGAFREGQVIGEDTDAWYRLAFRYKIAYCYKPKAIYYRSGTAGISSRHFIRNGVPPHFDSIRTFESVFDKNSINNYRTFIAKSQIKYLHPNLLTSNKVAAREIIDDCKEIENYRCKCLIYYILSLVPNFFYVFLYRIFCILKGRKYLKSNIVSIYRKDCKERYGVFYDGISL